MKLRAGLCVAGLATALVCACLPANGMAAEPDDLAVFADGPLSGGTVYSGDVSGSDHDWYVFYARPYAQLNLTIDNVDGGQCSPLVRLLDGWGEQQLQTGRAADGSRAAEDSKLPIQVGPAGARFLLDVAARACPGYDGASSSAYAFHLDGPGQIVAGQPLRGPVVATAEPNESASQAFGPIRGGVWYGGVKETSNDREVLSFVSAGRNLDVTVSSFQVGPTGVATTCEASAALARAGDEAGAGEHANFGGEYGAPLGHLREEPGRGTHRYILDVDPGAVGCRWQARVDQADAVAAPPTPAALCLRAKRKERAVRTSLTRAKRQLRHARSARNRRWAKRALRRQRHQLKKAVISRRRKCGGSRAALSVVHHKKVKP